MADKKLKFELTPRQLKAKDILNKEFLELEVWAISDIDPNRNNSHFTTQSLTDCKETFKNKPIVGMFEHDDFKSHEGHVDIDGELGNKYWNVERGERILGLIRESDTIEIVERNGLHWIKCTCAIWTKYCYNQVRKLLKDKTKKVSVEVTVTDSYDDEFGIEQINGFVLNGITILGQRNGKAVMEAIPGAHLDILEELDDESFNDQREMLSFAYQVLDDNMGDNDKNNEEKEGMHEMDNLEEQVNPETTGENEQFAAEENKENCECGGEKMATETEPEAEKCAEGNSDEGAKEEGKDGDEHCEADEGEEGHKDEDGGCDDCGDDHKCEAGEPATATESCGNEEFETLKADYASVCEQLAAKTAECEAMSVKIADYAMRMEAYADYEDIKARLATAEQSVFERFCSDMKLNAEAMMEGKKIIDEDREEIVMKASQGKYSCDEDLKKDIGYAMFKAAPACEGIKAVHFSAQISMPIENKGTDEKLTRAERIAARNQNK